MLEELVLALMYAHSHYIKLPASRKPTQDEAERFAAGLHFRSAWWHWARAEHADWFAKRHLTHQEQWYVGPWATVRF